MQHHHLRLRSYCCLSRHIVILHCAIVRGRTKLSLNKTNLWVGLRLVDVSSVLKLVLLVNEEFIGILMIMLLILDLDPNRIMLLFKFLLIHAKLRILSIFRNRCMIGSSRLIFLRIKNFGSIIHWVRIRWDRLRSFLIDWAWSLIPVEELLLRYTWIHIVRYRTHFIVLRLLIWSAN